MQRGEGRGFLIEEGHFLQAKIHRLETEVAVLREELRINGAQMRRIDSHRRPQFSPVERMAILELRTMCGWSKAETARRFFVSDARSAHGFDGPTTTRCFERTRR